MDCSVLLLATIEQQPHVELVEFGRPRRAVATGVSR